MVCASVRENNPRALSSGCSNDTIAFYCTKYAFAKVQVVHLIYTPKAIIMTHMNDINQECL